MSNVTLPKPKIQARKIDSDVLAATKAKGLHPLLGRIIAARPKPERLDLDALLASKLSVLDNPYLLQDMEKASKRLAKAIIEREIIGLETDHDCDGQTAHAVLYHNLVNKFMHPASHIRSYIGHRLEEGYGLSAKVAARILADSPKASLIITADNGSSDEERIKLLKAQHIDVIVTDHHQLPNTGPPASAYACLNPTRSDCAYPDPFIAGCMVAWLLVAATRRELIKQEYITEECKINDSLDFVAVGTVADCVSMARSYNNRAIVNYGLKLINSAIKPCWRAIQSIVNGSISAEDLAFKIGPLLNSDGRLASAFGSVSFLLATDDVDAKQWVTYLQEQNVTRKNIQNTITRQGMEQAALQVAEQRFSLCIYLEEGHPGVHGISASRIKDSFGRPTVFLAPKHGEKDVITGSIRGIEGFNVGAAIQYIMEQKPKLLLAGGGHAGAGGITLLKANYPAFVELFEQNAKQQLTSTKLGPVILTDGELDKDLIALDTVEILNSLEPFGREFEAPIFEIVATLENMRTIGDGSHARLELRVDTHKKINAVWFNFQTDAKIGDLVRVAFSLRINDFNNRKRCEMLIFGLSAI